MTTPANIDVVLTYPGDGTDSTFPITFPTFVTANVLAEVENISGQRISLALTTDFTLSSIGLPNTNGLLTLVDSNQVWLTPGGNLLTGWTLFIKFNSDAYNPLALNNLNAMSLKGIEKQFDRLSMAAKAVDYKASHAVGLSGLDADADPILPPMTGNAGKVVRVTETEDGFEFATGAAGNTGLPEGGVAGDFVGKTGPGDDDTEWTSGTFAGFSARYSATLNLEGIRAALLYIFQFSYLGPLISLAASGSGTVREKGATVSSTTLTATTTKRSDPIALVEFFRNGSEIAQNDPATNPGGGAEVYVDGVSFSDTTSFFARATDDGSTGGPSTVTSNTVTFTFVYPYYFGPALPGRTAAQVAALTKDIRVSTANLNKVFTAAGGDVYYFAYPASYGALTSILDENGFETFSSWTLRTENITGLDATAVSYRIYEFNNISSGGTTNFTFIR